jgi:hypothetical protein
MSLTSIGGCTLAHPTSNTDKAIVVSFILNPDLGVWDDDGIESGPVPHEHGTASPDQTGPGVGVAGVPEQ